MLLSDRCLRAALRSGMLAIDPLPATHIQPASIDIRLSRHFRVFRSYTRTHIDPAQPMPDLTAPISVDHEGLMLHPGEFVLGATVECVTLGADLAARLEGKSSLGRLGLLVHSTAGFVDPGFSGHITLELSNVATLPIKLYAGMKIGQLCVMRLSSTPERLYGDAALGSRYQGQQGPTESRSWKDFPPQ